MAVPPHFARRTLPADAVLSRWPAPDGHLLRRFDRPAAAATRRGSLLFLGGRGDFVEKYLEALGDWHDAGWAVTSVDWRGQGGSGRMTPHAHVGDIDDFARYVADLAALWQAWTAATPAPHVIVGHSMGGHILLRALAERQVSPIAAVLVAPMLGLKAPGGAGVGEALARFLASLGSSTRAAWKGNERPYTTMSRARLLTHDEDRYADEPWWQRQDVALLTGPPSWRWLVAAFASCRQLRAMALESVTTPVLMLVAEHDKLVDPAAALAIAGRLPDVRVVRFGAESAHEILREADDVRGRAMAEIDVFLDANAP